MKEAVKKRLAVITTHPIQYNAPLFELLAERNVIEIKVFYTWGKEALNNKFDPGFGRNIQWDIPLLSGYEYEFLNNIAETPGSHNYKGIDNPDILRSILDYKPNGLLIYGWSYKSHLKILRFFKKKIPILFRGDSTLLDAASLVKSALRRIFLRWVYRHIDYALYVGKSNYLYYKAMGLRDKQLICAPHAVDNERFSCTSSECANLSQEFRNNLSIDDKAFVFLFAGKFEAKKDPVTLIEAFIASDLYTKCQLIMVGDGPLKETLTTLASVIDSIHFVEFQNQTLMPAVYNSCNIFILPSAGPGETWGLAINEAMAAGKPIIASSKCGGVADLIVNNENGWIFPARNKGALALCMQKAYAAQNSLASKGALSKKIIADYNFLKVAEAVENTVISL